MNIELNLSRKIFNDVYYPYLLDYSHRYEVYYGGSGSGKSVFVFQKVVIKALNQVRKVLVVRKTMTSGKQSTYTLTLKTLEDFKLLQYCKVNKSDYTITLPNGSVFLFCGCDDVEKLKSIVGITDIICEEATDLTADDAGQLDLRLRPKEPFAQIFFLFNPVTRASWVYKRWFAPDAYINDKTFILQTTYKDNRFLSYDYVSAIEETIITNPTYYKIYALGEFASLDKLVFSNWEVADFDRTELKGQLLIGLDFGFTNDPTALIASLLDEENKKLYIFQEWGDTGKTNKDIAAAIKSLGFSKSIIVADAAEPKSVEEIRREGISRIKACSKGADSILHGIQKLQQYQIVIHPSCTEVITEFENYSWKKDRQTNEYINKPIDEFNHYIDALRYSLQCVNDGKIKVMNKNLLGL